MIKNKFRFTKEFRNRLVFKIPFRIATAMLAMVIIICVLLASYLSVAKKNTVNNEVKNLAQNNAFIVASYMSNMQNHAELLSKEWEI